MSTWPQPVRWFLVFLAPLLGYLAGNLLVGLQMLLTGSTGGPIYWVGHFILQPAAAALAAVAVSGYFAPRYKILAAVYGLSIVLIFVTLTTFAAVLVGEYVYLVPALATLAGGGYGIYLVESEK